MWGHITNTNFEIYFWPMWIVRLIRGFLRIYLSVGTKYRESGAKRDYFDYRLLLRYTARALVHLIFLHPYRMGFCTWMTICTRRLLSVRSYNMCSTTSPKRLAEVKPFCSVCISCTSLSRHCPWGGFISLYFNSVVSVPHQYAWTASINHRRTLQVVKWISLSCLILTNAKPGFTKTHLHSSSQKGDHMHTS